MRKTESWGALRDKDGEASVHVVTAGEGGKPFNVSSSQPCLLLLQVCVGKHHYKGFTDGSS